MREKVLQGQLRPLPGQHFFVTRMLKRDLFAVADHLVRITLFAARVACQ